MRVLAASLLLCAAGAWVEDPLDATPFAAACGESWGPNSCVFGDFAILSSNTPWAGTLTPAARVFGIGVPGEKIAIAGLPAKAVVLPSNPFSVPASGDWSVTISTADSPAFYNLSFTGSSSSSTLHQIRFGLTILASGQSNMDMSLDNCFYANETVAASGSYTDIVMKKNPSSGSWTVVGSDEKALRAFSAVGIFSAIHLKQSVPALKDVPIGVVQSSVGGTTIESWMSAEALAASGVINSPQCGFTGGCSKQAYCGNYNPLILPMKNFVFKTMLWYQGESNSGCNAAGQSTSNYYGALLTSLISSWRALFQTNFSAFVVSLAPTGRTDETPSARSGDDWPALRESQLSALQLPGAQLIYPIDLGDDGKSIYTPPSPRHGDLHPRNKSAFGYRIALAYAEMEGLLPAGVAGSGPALASAALAPDAGSVVLTFESGIASQGLRLAPTTDCYTFGRAGPGNATPADCCQNNSTDPRSPHGFPFEVQTRAAGGGAGNWTLARATLEGGGTQVRLVTAQCGNDGCPGWNAPLTGKVRYAWDAWPLCVLQNEQGLPLPPFVSA